MGKKYRAIVENQRVFYLKDDLAKEYIGSYRLDANCYKIENRQGELIGTVDKPNSSAMISLSRVGILETYKKKLLKNAF